MAAQQSKRSHLILTAWQLMVGWGYVFRGDRKIRQVLWTGCEILYTKTKLCYILEFEGGLDMKLFKNKMFWFVVFIILIHYPLLHNYYIDDKDKNTIKIAVEKLYQDYCHEDVVAQVSSNWIQEIGWIGGTVHPFYVETSSKKVPAFSGLFGRKQIVIREFGCYTHELKLDRESQRFIPVEPTEAFSSHMNDKAGIPLEILIFYFLIDCVSVLAIIVYILVRIIRNFVISRKRAQ
ncbi:hypothetical protein [Paenibacillus sp. UMB4589-SE434]|uniref:hypothetical protein n=1 Tax=Paenibacillus sp. UMB4589-SE434 TaxID=3046314 RepID=UPI00254FA6D3|nr:hypothetical protein [Paenibacillus sp. UMB4589-SE434]MDK8182037.1 hypothetical protein [Paenibacillus sp. UMB4589-SE434]